MKFSQRILLLLFCSLFSSALSACRKRTLVSAGLVRWFGGQVEVELPEGPRVDCITKTHAIEMDFARKWPEAGLASHSISHSHLTGLEAGIVLILRSHNDTPHLTLTQGYRKTIKPI